MEALPLWAIISGICGGIITILGALEKIMSAKKVITAPEREQDKRIASLEARCDAYDRYFDSDKQRISDLEISLSIMMRAEFALLSHAVNGNDVDKLKEAQTEMFNYLSQRGILT